jgi:hypothetical protein
MAKFVDMTVSFYNHLKPNASSSVGIRYCPLCGTDLEDSSGTPFSALCEHVMFTYFYTPGEFFDVHESLSELTERVPEDANPAEWVTQNIDSDSVICFDIRPKAGEDAEPIAIAFDFSAVISQTRGV